MAPKLLQSPGEHTWDGRTTVQLQKKLDSELSGSKFGRHVHLWASQSQLEITSDAPACAPHEVSRNIRLALRPRKADRASGRAQSIVFDPGDRRTSGEAAGAQEASGAD